MRRAFSGSVDAVRGRKQGHDGRVSDVGQQVHGLVQLHLLAQLLCGPRYFHECANGVGGGVVKSVVALGAGIHRDAEDRVFRHIFDHPAFEIRLATVIQRRSILVSRHHGAVPPLRVIAQFRASASERLPLRAGDRQNVNTGVAVSLCAPDPGLGRRVAQRCTQPPLNGMACPTKKLLSSLARNSAKRASSSAVARRPRGTWRFSDA